MELSQCLVADVLEAGGVHLVSLRGELDLSGAGRLQLLLTGLAGSTVEVDLARLSFIDAAGITALADAKQQVEKLGHLLVLRGATKRARELFDVLGLSELLEPPS